MKLASVLSPLSDANLRLAIIRTLKEIGFDGPIRPDHVQQYAGD